MIFGTRTPLRVSLFGGGTDYPGYFSRRPGAVLGFAINKYIYMSALPLQAFVDYRFRLSYSVVEHVDEVSAINHPVVRAVLEMYGWSNPLDVSFQSDLPASAGLGSSSAFTVGFLKLILKLSQTDLAPEALARTAIHVEQTLLNENVGVQDQMHAAFGGFNRFDFHGDDYRVSPIAMPAADLDQLTDSMLLVYTGIKRRATQVVADQMQNTAERKVDRELDSLVTLVGEAQAILEGEQPIDETALEIGRLLHDGWQIKKSLAAGVSNPVIDDLYALCRANGAVGGKLCGAGAGGFLLVVVPKDRIDRFVQALGERRCVRFKVDRAGSCATVQGTAE